ncbi:MAG: ABC transporter permease [Desulfovibrio sp.]|nr:ABC transporter permease [Desulfovibrio sp.]
MNIFTIPARHIRRKWLRSLMLAAVFTLGLASMVGLYQVSTQVADNLERKLISYGANILVTPKRETLKISYGGYDLGDVAIEEHVIDLAAARRAIDGIALRGNVAVIAPRMLATARVDGKSIALVGVDFTSELELKGYWNVDGAFPASNERGDILAGGVAAEKLRLRVGQILSVNGQDLRISGVLNLTGNDDDTVLFVPIQVAQTLAGKPGQAAFLEVAALCSGCPIEDIVNQLQAALPDADVRALAQVAETRMYAVHFVQRLAFSVSLVILVTACAMLVMSMLSAVAERRKEIGIMRAVGFSRKSVFMVFVAEALSLGALSGAAGYALGQCLAVYVLDQLHLVEETRFVFDPAALGGLVAVAALMAGLAAAFPAWRATMVEPAEALVAL